MCGFPKRFKTFSDVQNALKLFENPQGTNLNVSSTIRNAFLLFKDVYFSRSKTMLIEKKWFFALFVLIALKINFIAKIPFFWWPKLSKSFKTAQNTYIKCVKMHKEQT